jgi:ubiquinone/menaquinone biosynthesis C-methylase UbiE
MTAEFVSVTEIEGQQISAEQLYRTCHRYHWAARLCAQKDVLEVACGAGQGLGLLQTVSKSITAGDVSPEVLATAQKTYGPAIALSAFGAEDLPFPDASFDMVLMFEALYYVPNIAQFFSEARRVLRPGGTLLIVTANKDLYDFTPSPFSRRYLGVVELSKELAAAGYASQFAALIDTRTVSVRQRILRPVKLIASKLGLIPKTMHGKEWMKKLFFGEMTLMPADISALPFTYSAPTKITFDKPDLTHKVIYCSATLQI